MTQIAAVGQNLPDLYTYLWPGINFHLSTNQVVGGDVLVVSWAGDNNDIVCIDPPCPEQIGRAYGPWDDGVFLVSGSTNWFLGTGTFTGQLPPGGGYYSQRAFQIPSNMPPGLYGVKIWIDYVPGVPGGKIVEINENNNTFIVQAAVTVLPSLSLAGISLLPSGSVRLELRGSTAQQVRIQASMNLESTSWTDLVSLPPLSGTAEYVDDSATNYPSCFYRAISP
jgi:hypothetical protein